MTAMATPLADGAVLVSRHVDALELTCSVVQVPTQLMSGPDDRLERYLAEHRDRARALRPQSPVECDLEWNGSERLIVHPGPMRSGTRYSIECSDWIAFIATTTSILPRLTFQFRADHLLAVGADTALASLRSWTETHLVPRIEGRQAGESPIWRISRLDIAADVLNAHVVDTDVHRFRTRAAASDTHQDGWDFL